MSSPAARRREGSNGSGSIMRAALGGLPSGAGFGAWVGSIAVRMNPSLAGPRQATAFVLLTVAGYAFALGLVGLLAGVIARPLEKARGREDEGFLPDFVAPLAGAITFALVQGVLRRFSADGGESDIVQIAIALAACLCAAVALRVVLSRVVSVSTALWGAIGVAAAATPVFVWITLRSAGALRFGAEEVEPSAAAMVTEKPHVVVLALDGADWARLTPLMEAGRLPNFSRLCDGARAALLPPIEPVCSQSAWTSIATSVREDAHGVIDASELVLPFLDCGVQRAQPSSLGEPLLPRNVGLVPVLAALRRYDLAADLPISATQRRRKTFWNVLSDRGIRVGVVGWPASWPAEKLEGYAVADDLPVLQKFAATKLGSGDNSKSARTTWPPELTSELVPLIEADGPLGDPGEVALQDLLAHPVLADLGENERLLFRGDVAMREQFELLVRGDRFATRAAVHVWTEKTINVLVLRLRSIGGIARCMPQFPGVIDHACEFTDGLLGEVLAASPADTTFILVSERGERLDAQSDAPRALAAGVFVIRGPSVVAPPDAELLEPSPFDVAPTVLALFGLPPEKEWVGRPLLEAFATESAAGQAREAVATYGPYRPTWPELAEITELASQREALRLLRDLGALAE